MNTNQMRQFATVARHRSMTRAAAELYVTQQALSKTIKLLQNEMGGELFVSSGQGLQLTDLGNKLLAIVESLLPRYDSCMAMIASLVEQNRNRLSICYEHSFFQYVIPTEMMKGGAISVRIADDPRSCQEDVRQGRVDLGVGSPPEDGEGLEYVPLLRQPLRILLRSSHPLARKDELSIRDLEGAPQIMPSIRSIWMNRYINECIEEGFYPNFVLETGDLGLMLRSVLSDNLLLVCPACAVEEGLEGTKVLPLRREGLESETGLMIREGNRLPRLWEFIGELCGRYPPAENAENRTIG